VTHAGLDLMFRRDLTTSAADTDYQRRILKFEEPLCVAGVKP
jgi:hypothetical protein